MEIDRKSTPRNDVDMCPSVKNLSYLDKIWTASRRLLLAWLVDRLRRSQIIAEARSLILEVQNAASRIVGWVTLHACLRFQALEPPFVVEF